MRDRNGTPISVQVLWLIAWLRVLVVLLSVGLLVWLAFPEPSGEWLRSFRAGYATAAGYSGPVLGPEELGAALGRNSILWVLTCLVPVALHKRSISGVRWILGIQALFALSSAPLGLLVIALMLALTFPTSAWAYWYGPDRVQS